MRNELRSGYLNTYLCQEKDPIIKYESEVESEERAQSETAPSWSWMSLENVGSDSIGEDVQVVPGLPMNG
jgi:hypothetical protein